MELKEVLVLLKINFYKINKFSNGIKNKELKILQRVVLMDEVNILRRNEEISFIFRRKEFMIMDDEFLKK